jgi:hypothetical protein
MRVLFPWIIFHSMKLVKNMICVMDIDLDAVLLPLNFMCMKLSVALFKHSVHTEEKWFTWVTGII